MTVTDLVDQAVALDLADPLAHFRDQFIGSDDPKIIAYLDGNSLGRPLRATRDRIRNFVDQVWGSRLIRAWDEGWMDDPVRIGDDLGRVALGAASGQTVVGDSTSVMLYKWIRAAVASQPERHEIVLDVGNFPTDRFVLEGIAAELGMRLIWLAADRTSGITVEQIAKVINSGTALIVLSDVAYRSGFLTDVAAITARAMRGDIEFAPALRERVGLLKGLRATAVDEVIDERIRLTPGARTLVATLRGNGAYTCLVTGGFTLFSQRIAALIGFDENRANTLMIDGDGRLTGDVSEPIFGREAKLATLIELTRKLALAPERTLVAGDGANDIAMIQAAGLGVAYHAKPKVAEAAAARIDHGDLTALLYAQGYRRDEFVSVEG